MKILYTKSNNKSEHVKKKKNENNNSKMNSFERQEHRSEPISTWQARDQQVADLAFLQKNKPLGVTRACAFYRCVLRDNDYEAQCSS